MPPTRIVSRQTQGLQETLQSGTNVKTINGLSVLGPGNLDVGRLRTLNGQTGSTQTFQTGTAGSNFSISSSSNVHTFHLPDASPTARGLVTTETQTFAGTKQFAQLTATRLIVGSTTDAGYMADIHGNTMVRGDITATGNIQGYATSDQRLKRGIQKIHHPLAILERIEGVRFDWKPEFADLHPFRGADVGLLAQQVREVLPEAVGEMQNGYLGVKYDRLIPVLVEALKELKQEVETLKRS